MSYDPGVSEVLSRRLKDISPKAYEHPADRAATAALQSIPGLDAAIRGAGRDALRARVPADLHGERDARRAAAASRGLVACGRRPSTRSTSRTGSTSTSGSRRVANAAAIGSKKPMVVGQLDHGHAARRAGAADGARPRGGPHPLRPRPLPDRARDAAAALAARSGCRCSAGCRCWRCARCCSSGSAPPSSRPTAPRRSSTATRSSPRGR